MQRAAAVTHVKLAGHGQGTLLLSGVVISEATAGEQNVRASRSSNEFQHLVECTHGEAPT
jgi:hypothetical protein